MNQYLVGISRKRSKQPGPLYMKKQVGGRELLAAGYVYRSFFYSHILIFKYLEYFSRANLPVDGSASYSERIRRRERLLPTLQGHESAEQKFTGGIDRSGPVRWRPGDIILNDYRIIAFLGEGGNSTVYLAEHLITEHQFAVKVPNWAFRKKSRQLSLFFRELRTWANFPSHPNITKCFYYKTTEDRVIIFCEVMQEGSLSDWIAEKRLTKLEDALDFAIQVAWGLEAIHHNRIIHQDIKPSNILINADREAKINDFGLARAHEILLAEDPTHAAKAKSDASLSTGFFTPAYCSLEQSQGRQLGNHSDIWSFGLTMLTMFTGVNKWIFGALGQDILKGMAARDPDPDRPDFIPEIQHVIGKCLEPKPGNRWQSARDIAEELIGVYRQITKKEYFRKKPPIPFARRVIRCTGIHNNAVQSSDFCPRQWVIHARSISSRSRSEMKELILDRPRTDEECDIFHLEFFEDAVKIYTAEIDRRNDRNLIREFILMLERKADVHRESGDFSGAIAVINRAIQLVENRLKEPEPDDRLRLSKLHGILAGDYYFFSDFQQCATHHEIAVRIAADQFHSTPNVESLRVLIQSILAHTSDLAKLGRGSNALRCVGKAEGVIESLDQSLLQEVVHERMKFHLVKGRALQVSLKIPEALAEYDRALEMLTSSPNPGDASIQMTLSTVRINRGLCLVNQGKPREAIKEIQAATELLKNDYADPNNSEAQNQMAVAEVNLGMAWSELGEYEKAVHYTRSAVDKWERLVMEFGIRNTIERMSFAYLNLGHYFQMLEDHDNTVDSLRKSAKFLTRLLMKNSNPLLKRTLILNRINFAEAMHRSGNTQYALSIYKDAEKMLMDGKDVIAAESDFGMVLAGIGSIYAETGQFSESEKYLNRAIPLLEDDYKKTRKLTVKMMLDQAREAQRKVISKRINCKSANPRPLIHG